MNILLVEPDYYTRYPPLSLLKLSTYYKELGDNVWLVRGAQFVDFRPDRIHVTSLFTWDLRSVWRAVRFYKGRRPSAELSLRLLVCC